MEARWKDVNNCLLVLLMVLIVSTVQATGSQGSDYIQTSGNVIYPSFKVGVYGISWNFNEYNASTIANTFDMSQSWYVGPPPSSNDYSAKMSQVHALNPDYKFLVYRNVLNIYDYLPDEWNYANSQGWLLKDINGNYVIDPNPSWSDNYVADITNQSYQQWIGAKVKLWLDECPTYDGVMADNSLKYSAQEFDWCCKTRPINPQTGTYFTTQEIWDGCAGVLNAIIGAIGPNKLIVPNGIWSGFVGDRYNYILSKVPRLNGLMSEGTFRAYDDQWYSETDWLSSIDFVVGAQDNLLNVSGGRFTTGCTVNPLPSGATAEQVIMYGFCSMLLSTKYSSPQNTISFGFSQDFLPTSSLLQLLQKLRTTDMVRPLGDYYKINLTSVYARNFVKGKVLVNPSSLSQMVTLDGSYTTFDGRLVSDSLTVEAHSGTILFI